MLTSSAKVSCAAMQMLCSLPVPAVRCVCPLHAVRGEDGLCHQLYSAAYCQPGNKVTIVQS